MPLSVVDGDLPLAEALAAAGQSHLVISDLNLPVMDGLAVLNVMRGRSCAASVMTLAARVAAKDRVRGLDLGARLRGLLIWLFIATAAFGLLALADTSAQTLCIAVTVADRVLFGSALAAAEGVTVGEVGWPEVGAGAAFADGVHGTAGIRSATLRRAILLRLAKRVFGVAAVGRVAVTLALRPPICARRSAPGDNGCPGMDCGIGDRHQRCHDAAENRAGRFVHLCRQCRPPVVHRLGHGARPTGPATRQRPDADQGSDRGTGARCPATRCRSGVQGAGSPTRWPEPPDSLR